MALFAKEVPIRWTPDLPIYASEPYLKAMEKEYGWIGGFDKAGELLCVLPYTVAHKALLRMVRFRSQTILFSPDLTVNLERSFLNSIIAYFRSKRIDLIIPPSANSLFRTYPDEAITVPYGTYILDLNQTEDALWTKIHSKHRNVIRNARNKGVQIDCGMQNLDKAYNLIRTTLARSRMPLMDSRKFQSFVSSLGDQISIFVASHNGQ